MADPDLIAETNRLLRELLERDAEQRARSAETMAKFDERRKETQALGEERRRAGLREQGLPEEAVEGTDDEWETRQKVAQERSKEKIEAIRERNERHQEALLQELRTQSDLLRQIAERLDR